MTSPANRWRGCAIAVLIGAMLVANSVGEQHQLFSEGGSFGVQQQDETTNSRRPADYLFEDGQLQQQQPIIDQETYFPGSVEQQLANFEEQRKRERLANIVAQLRENSGKQFSAQEMAGGPGVFVDESEEGNRNDGDIDWETLKEGGGERERPEAIVEENVKKIETVKKGQSEFVEFVEPRQSNRLNKPEWMEEKRTLPEELPRNSFNFFSNSGNLLFMAYLAICCAGIVAGTFGGIYYYNHVRANRVDDPFNEFTRYSPAGRSGKEKPKRVGGSPTFGQSGDDTLAYKAQLHHYQQQKQKILGSASSPVHENMSDAEEDTDEMDHNYSVFECPGLAPTGDLEIQNPNFTGAEKTTDQTRRAD